VSRVPPATSTGCSSLSRPCCSGCWELWTLAGGRQSRTPIAKISGLKPLPPSTLRRLQVAIPETGAADSRLACRSPSGGGHHERSTPQPLVVRRRDCGLSRVSHESDIACRRFPTSPRGILRHRRRHAAGILHPDPPSRRHATQDGSGPPAGSQATKWVIPFLERA
jgi:hypothetical protein